MKAAPFKVSERVVASGLPLIYAKYNGKTAIIIGELTEREFSNPTGTYKMPAYRVEFEDDRHWMVITPAGLERKKPLFAPDRWVKCTWASCWLSPRDGYLRGSDTYKPEETK